MKQYDYLVVGAGLFGAVFARQATDAGKKVLVIDKRDHIAGNVYTEQVEGIHVHRYGAHIFHTNNKTVWDYITRFAEFNRFTNSPVANYKGELYSLPFNMYTFNKMWGVITPQEAADKINRAKESGHRVIAVGTTSTRTLEAAADENGRLHETSGWTEIFIYPGYQFKVIDALITNFHLPQSTLVMLVSALAGREHVLHAYEIAVKERYRFFSFGDAMLIQ